MAIKNSSGQIIGVIQVIILELGLNDFDINFFVTYIHFDLLEQLINKFNGLLFTKNDENFVEAFAIFCGMGIHNTNMYEKAITAMAKQSVTLDVS